MGLCALARLWMVSLTSDSLLTSLQSTSAACGSSLPSSVLPPLLPPPLSTTSTVQSSPAPHTHTLTSSSDAPPTIRGSPVYTTVEAKPTISSSFSPRNGSPPSSRRGSHRGTPSPTGSYRGLLGGSHHGSVRNSPYISPHTSPRSSLRVRSSSRGATPSSPHGSTHSSPRSSVHGSPPPIVPQQLPLAGLGAGEILVGHDRRSLPNLSPQRGTPSPTGRTPRLSLFRDWVRQVTCSRTETHRC